MKKIVIFNGLGFGSILFFIFLILKLVGVISWSWLWVTAPLWFPPFIFVSIVCLVILALLIIGWLN